MLDGTGQLCGDRANLARRIADVLLDRRWPDLIRRKALLARLTSFAVEGRDQDATPATTSARVRLAEQLAQLQLYAVLSPLEKLFELHEDDIAAYESRREAWLPSATPRP